jgi:transposase-like protein
MNEEYFISELESIRWPQGLRCIRCGLARIRIIQSATRKSQPRRLYWCADCHYQYSVTAGTLFHDSHLPLSKWFLAIYLISRSAKRVSAKRVQRELCIAYETAWTITHRIRLATGEQPDFCEQIARAYHASQVNQQDVDAPSSA